MRKDLTFEKLFGKRRHQPLFDEEESSVASFVYNYAYEEIHGDGYDALNIDPTENFSSQREELMIRLECIAEIFKNSRQARVDFLSRFNRWAPFCKETIKLLRKIAEDLKDDNFKRNGNRACWSVIAAIGGILAVLCPPGALPVAGAFAFALGNNKVIKSACDEIAFLEESLKTVKALLVEERKRFSAMTDWFSRPKKLEESIDSLLDRDVLNEISKEVQKLTETVTGEKDITEEEFKNQFQELLKHSMGLMGKDSKMIDKYGKELAPAVMTFVFVILLMNDHNRVVLDCSSITQHLALSLGKVLNMGTIAGGLAIAEGAVSHTLIWIGVAINAIIAVLSLINMYRQPETTYTTQIREAADKIEKIYLFIEEVYTKTKSYRTPDDQWAQVLLSRVPEDAVHADLEQAVSHYLPEAAMSQIKICKLSTEEGNWLVKVPRIHFEILFQQSEIKIKNQNCSIVH